LSVWLFFSAAARQPEVTHQDHHLPRKEHGMIRTIQLFKQGLPVALVFLFVLLVVFLPCPRIAWAAGGNIKANMYPLVPFQHKTGMYIFGKEGHRALGWSPVPDDNAANWWRINDDPKTGFSPQVLNAKMSSEYQAVTSFELNGYPYIFGLHRGAGGGDGHSGKTIADVIHGSGIEYGVGANIWRINNDAKGFELVMFKGKMSGHYKQLVSFQLKGEPHILGLHWDGGANIWRIRDDGVDKDGKKKLAMDLVKYNDKMSPKYEYLKVFYVGQHPHVIGRHEDVGTNIWRVKDGAVGLQLVAKGLKMPKYGYVFPFHMNDRVYLLAIGGGNEPIIEPEKYTDAMRKKLDPIVNVRGSIVEWGKGYGCIWEVTPKTITKVGKCVPMSRAYTQFTTFEKDGKVYLFGTHFHGQDLKNGYANIWRINDNLADGFTMEYCGEQGGPCSPTQ
jgi:hypothetical protein